MRDLLPGFVHQTLTASDHARVAAHVVSCDACGSEVELIRTAALAFPIPPTELSRILAALADAPARPVRAGTPAPRRRVQPWLVAAIVSFVLIGGTALFARRVDVMRRYTGTAPSSIGGTSRLSTEQLQLLLREIERVDLRPSTEPEAARRPLIYPVWEVVD